MPYLERMPRHATPRHATPHHATPRHAAQERCTTPHESTATRRTAPSPSRSRSRSRSHASMRMWARSWAVAQEVPSPLTCYTCNECGGDISDTAVLRSWKLYCNTIQHTIAKPVNGTIVVLLKALLNQYRIAIKRTFERSIKRSNNALSRAL